MCLLARRTLQARQSTSNFQGLMMNALNGNVENNNIDYGEGGAINPQYLSLDPTEWNEFWIVLTNDASGLGTHVAFVYVNGSLSAQVFHLTAAGPATDISGVIPTTTSYFAIGCAQDSDGSSAIDIDFLAYRFAAVFPAGASQPPTISGVAPIPRRAEHVLGLYQWGYLHRNLVRHQYHSILRRHTGLEWKQRQQRLGHYRRRQRHYHRDVSWLGA